MWQAAVLVIFSASPSMACCGPDDCQHSAIGESPSGPPGVCDSSNFQVISHSPRFDAPALAQCCESWRQHLQAKWLGSASAQSWSPRCDIVVHARRETYRAAIGRGGEQSFGSSLIDFQAGKISRRRIDLLIDPQGAISALGHELTHVVIADAFPSSRPPAWVNEGAAVLADSADKQQLHKRDLDQSFQRQAAFHCADLIQMLEYPAPHRIPAFYGQSASLIAFLGDIGGAEKLIPFIKDAGNRGYDLALREHYGLQGVAELHRRWLRSNSL